MENVTVRLRRVESPPDVKAYMLDEWQHLEGNKAHLVMVEFRVNVGRDAFPVQVLLDRRETAEDQLVPEARRRAAAMFREALNTLKGQEASEGGPAVATK